MKKIIAIVCILLFSATAVLADEVEDALAGLANEQIMVTTRLMVQNGIEKDDAIGLTKLMLQNQFSLQQTLQAQQMLMQALQSGVPAEPLMSKAYEGMTKKVKAVMYCRPWRKFKLVIPLPITGGAISERTGRDKRIRRSDGRFTRRRF